MNESECFELCNNNYKSLDPRRTFCKKGCRGDGENKEDCFKETCEKLFIKHEIGEDGNKWGCKFKFQK